MCFIVGFLCLQDLLVQTGSISNQNVWSQKKKRRVKNEIEE